jgi:hypothetical protein
MTDGRLNRGQDLEEDEDETDNRQGAGKIIAMLHCGNQHAHGNRKERRQDCMQNNDPPPGEREPAVGLRQRRKGHPLLARTQTLKQSHDRILAPIFAQDIVPAKQRPAIPPFCFAPGPRSMREAREEARPASPRKLP